MILHTLRIPTIVAADHLPTLLARDSALEQACERIVDAGLAGARWVIFPEGCIPGYPAWVWALYSSTDPLLDALRAEIVANTVRIPSDVTDRLCQVAQRAQVNLAIGVIECDNAAGGVTCYSTMLFINAQGQMMGIYRLPVANEATQGTWVPAKHETPAAEASALSRMGGI